MIRNFFLADDDPDDSDMFREALSGIKPEVELNYTKNCKGMIDKLHAQEQLPDIIFLDINMPEINGWQCLARLKADAALREIPVLLYSTSPAELLGKRAIESGAFAFYEKPSDFKKLCDFLKAVAHTSKDKLSLTLKELRASHQHNVVTS